MRWRTAASVAAAAGLSRQYVHNIVHRRQTHASREHLRALLGVLGLELSDYVDDPAAVPQSWTLPAMFDSVSNEDRVEIERLLAWILAVHRRSRRRR